MRWPVDRQLESPGIASFSTIRSDVSDDREKGLPEIGRPFWWD